MTKILIIDDDLFFAHMLAERLRREIGMDQLVIEETGSAGEAYQKVKNAHEPYDILLVNNRLEPGASGIEVIEELRLHSSDLDFVLFTEYDEPEVGRRAYTAGAYRYLVKPLDSIELVWIVQSLIQHRSINYERNWLHLLTEVTEKTHKATSVSQVAEVLVQGGLRLGFQRALFRLEQNMDDRQVLLGVRQAGHAQIHNFEGLCIPLSEAKYAKTAIDGKMIRLFRGDELGPGFPFAYSETGHFPIANGEWVCIPLMNGENCLGILVLDNDQQARLLRAEQYNLLHLFGGQAAAALNRAVTNEREQFKHQALELVSRTRQQATKSAKTQSLDTLLMALYEQIIQVVPCDNFMVLIGDKKSNWFQYCLHIEHGKRQPHRWRGPKEGGLITHLVELGKPLFLPSAVEEYRDKHHISQIGPQPAQSWIGVPLYVGENTFGALVFEHDGQANAFDEHQFRLLQTITEELSSTIQAAWLREHEVQRSQRLTLLQQASEILMILAEKNEDFLWHATLTLATAGYGFGFERAMLFLVEEGGTRLRGRMGIGNFKLEDAESDWSQDEVNGLDFKEYLECLRSGTLRPTPVEIWMRNCLIELGPADSAFARVLCEGNIESVKANQATIYLPKAFVDQFGVADYDIVPCKAGARTIGLVIVDTYFQRHPPRREFLPHLGRLMNETALIYENLRKSWVQAQLIEITHTILVKAHNQPLKETLQEICCAAQNIMGADFVTIYPLQDTPYPQFDHSNKAIIGNVNDSHIERAPRPDGLTKYILDAGILVINDVAQDKRLFSGCPLTEHYIIASERIRALIGVPVYDLLQTKIARGVLYLDFRSTQSFTNLHFQLAESLAHLVAVAIKNWREAEGLRYAIEDREEELCLLGDVLQEALKYGSDEKTLIATLLQKTTQSLAPRKVKVGLLLKDWQRTTTPLAEPVEVRRQYYLMADNNLSAPSIEKDIYRGISGLALKTGEPQYVPDVLDNAWHNIFYESPDTRSELDIPIKLREQTIGVFNIESPQENAFKPAHIAMVEHFASAAALAIDNVRRQDHLNTILQAAKAVTAPSKLEKTLAAILEAVQKAVSNLSALAIWYRDPEHGELVLGPSFGINDKAALQRAKPITNPTIQRIMERSEPLWVDDVTQTAQLGRKFINRERVISAAAFPLKSVNGAIGAMFFNYRQPHQFTDEERSLFPILAEFVASAINDAAQLEKTRKERKRLELALDITEAVGTELNIQQTLTIILKRLKTDKLFPDTTPCILLYNQATRKLDFSLASREFYQIDNPEYANMTDAPLDDHSIFGHLALESMIYKMQRVSNIDDVSSNSSYLNLQSGTQSQLTVTLYSDKQGLLGVLLFESTTKNAFDKDHERMVQAVAKQIQLALERAYLSASIRRMDTVASASFWAVDIAHEINPETGMIRNSAYWLKTELELSHALSEERLRCIEDIEHAAEHLASVMSNVDALRSSEEAQAEDIEQLLRIWVNDVAEKREADTKVTFDFRTNGLCVKTQAIALHYVIRYVVRNALEAMGWKTEQQLFVRTFINTNQLLEIQIEDTGPGITDPQIQLNLFKEPTTSKGQGHGFSMLFAYEAIKRIGGAISLLPHIPGKGAIFDIILPVVAPSTSMEQENKK